MAKPKPCIAIENKHWTNSPTSCSKLKRNFRHCPHCGSQYPRAELARSSTPTSPQPRRLSPAPSGPDGDPVSTPLFQLNSNLGDGNLHTWNGDYVDHRASILTFNFVTDGREELRTYGAALMRQSPSAFLLCHVISSSAVSIQRSIITTEFN